MIITKKQLEEIRRGLAVLGVRDTDMPPARPLSGDEKVAIVQGGENRLASLADMFEKYYEDILDYAARGKSAFELWVELPGNEGKTINDFFAYLKAAVQIDNEFHENSPYVAASASEAIRLLGMIQVLQQWKEGASTSLNSFDSRLAALQRAVAGLTPGSALTVIDDRFVADHSNPPSAAKLKEVKDMLDSIIAAGQAFSSIKTWAEFKALDMADNSVKYDERGVLVNVRTAYELYRMLQDLLNRVSDLENNSGSGGSGSGDGGDDQDGKTYKLVVEADGDKTEMNAVDTLRLYAYYETYEGERRVGRVDVSSNENCFWLENNPYVEVSGGVVTSNNPLQETQVATITAVYNNISTQYQIAIRKVGGDDQPAAEPYITINPSGVAVVDSDGFFGTGESRSAYKEFAVTVNNSTSSWKIASNQDLTWLTAEKVSGTGALKISGVNSYMSRTEERSQVVTICLESDPTITASVTIKQLAMGYSEMDFRIFSQDSAAVSHVFPGIGDEHIIVVQSPEDWVIDWTSIPSWVEITHYVMGSSSRVPVSEDYVGGPGETALRLTVEASETDHAAVPIVCTLKDNPSVRALYYISQDTSVTNVIKLRDVDGLTQVVFSYAGANSYGLVLLASGDWTATCKHSWFKFVSGTGYTVVDDYTATGSATTDGPISLNIEVSELEGWGGRVSAVQATLDDTGLHSLCYVIQNENDNAYSALLYPVPGTDTYALTVNGGAQGHPSWYVFLDRPNYSPASYVHFPSDLWVTDSWGWTEVRCPYDVGTIRGITIDEDDIPSGTEYIEIKVNVANGQGTTVYARLAVSEITNRADEQGEGETPIVYNTLDASLVGTSPVSADTTSVTIHVASTTGWAASESSGKQITPSSSVIAGSNTADIVVAIGENTGNTRNFSVTVTSTDQSCVPPSKTVTFVQSAAEQEITYSIPSSVTIPSGSVKSVTFGIESSVSWELERSSGSGIYSAYIFNPTSGNGDSTITLTSNQNSNPQTDQYGSLKFYQIIDGTSVSRGTIEVIKAGAQQTPTIAADTDTISILAAGNTGTPVYDSVTVTPAGSTWTANVTSGDTSAITATADNANGRLVVSVSENAQTSARSWNIRLYNGTTYCDVAVTQAAATVVRPAAPEFRQNGNEVSIDCATVGASIHYKEGVTSQTFDLYTGAITIDSDTTFYAYSELNGVRHSADTLVSFNAIYDDGEEPVPLELSLSQNSIEYDDALAHSDTLTVTITGDGAQSESWTATAESPVVITSGSTGTGNGTISFSIPANSGSSQVQGAINVELDSDGTINDGCTITQAAATPVSASLSIAAYGTWNEDYTEIEFYVEAENDNSSARNITPTVFLRKNQNGSTPPTSEQTLDSETLSQVTVPANTTKSDILGTLTYTAGSGHEDYFWWLGVSLDSGDGLYDMTYVQVEDYTPPISE